MSGAHPNVAPTAAAATSAGARESCQDLADAVAGWFPVISGVTGKPVTHLIEHLHRDLPGFVWAFNEKTAVENAVGASIAGTRSCVVMKHNGLGLALDTITNAGVHTIGAALVIVVGDDPDAANSTCVLDSRELAAAARVPILEPVGNGDVAATVEMAVTLSEQAKTPVLVRVTPRLHAPCSGGAPAARAGAVIPPALVGERHDRAAVAHRLTKLGRVQWQRLVTMPTFEQASASRATETRCACDGTTAVVAVGAAAECLPDDVCCAVTLRVCWPVPEAVVDFASGHGRVLVVEDSDPQVERHLLERTRGGVEILGRTTGHLPPEGSLSSPAVVRALTAPEPDTWETARSKDGAPADPGVYATLFEAVAGLHRSGTFVAADVGSAVRLCYPPYEAADAALCLGSAISVAGGAARTGQRAVGVIGDYGLLHSGLQSVLEIVTDGLPVLTVVLANDTQAQTGGQPVPQADFPALLTACGIEHIDSWDLDELDARATFERLSSLLLGPLPAVAIVRADRRPKPGDV
ncbi:thiamine pyrophosphate-dependent enzyme [Promicromonospora sukumoe]|uniref:thiamine pyrophosphate-dependent enzyme n=1 Tax=Promicromonospora sukumoe TaxID=88382 RepID=UPI0012FCA022|nr:thiamine pyrophosphate-dependent enzyme [Promicromonospora sukumoe]